jgi:hypothetical protein
MRKRNTLRNVRELLHTAAYFPREIERVLDRRRPCFVKFDPVLGYELKDYVFRDGMEQTLSTYVYEKRGGHRRMVHYADQRCRLNTYGDSYTQCAQVSDAETWQELLAAHFREPIRNFGVGGYGVYQAYRRALRTEVQRDLAAPYLILNIWDDDHMRNIDAARWIRVGWMCRDLPRGGGRGSYPVHGFPWAHVRYDLSQGRFVERPGLCRRAADLRKLVGKDAFYAAFKDDPVAHLYALREGGDAPVTEAEQIAEAFRLKVNLRDRRTRTRDALALHRTYGLRSTAFILDKLSAWCRDNGRKLMVLLSYDVPTVWDYLEKGTRFDEEMLDYLRRNRIRHVDFLAAAREEYRAFKTSIPKFLERFYVARAGAQVFGHYNPYGNFWFAYTLRPHLVEWLNPRPPAYR